MPQERQILCGGFQSRPRLCTRPSGNAQPQPCSSAGEGPWMTAAPGVMGPSALGSRGLFLVFVLLLLCFLVISPGSLPFHAGTLCPRAWEGEAQGRWGPSPRRPAGTRRHGFLPLVSGTAAPPGTKREPPAPSVQLLSRSSSVSHARQ